MARWTASAKWAAGPALDGQRDMPLALRLSEGLDPGQALCSMPRTLKMDSKCEAKRQGGFRAAWMLLPKPCRALT